MRLSTVCRQIRHHVPGLEFTNVQKIKMLALNDLMCILTISRNMCRLSLYYPIVIRFVVTNSILSEGIRLVVDI